MGTDVRRLTVGQRATLTDPTPRAARRIAFLTLLALDGVLSAVGAALLLPSYLGTVPFPISAPVSGLLNAALVWAAGLCTISLRVAALPLWTWLLTVFAMCWPGNGLVLGGREVMAYSPLLLLVAGAGPPFWVLLRRRIAH